MRFWAIFVILFILFLVVLSNILLPFVLGMAVAYFLDPVADKLEEKGMGRTAATALIVGSFLLVSSLTLILLVPALAEQLIGLLKRMPGYLTAFQDLVKPLVLQVVDIQGMKESGELKAALTGYAGNIVKSLGALATNVIGQGFAFFNLLSLLVITPVVAFYLLRDWDRIVERVDGWIPRGNLKEVRSIAKDIDNVLAGFVRGQSVVCLILAIFYGVSLLAAGLEFGLIIGILTGLISFIPFVGAIVGLVASVGVAIFQFWPDFLHIALIGGIFVVGQILEGYVLTPKMVGEKVGLHPVWVMFGLLAGGSLFGFVGILIAVPVAAVVGVLTRYALNQYMDSPVYGTQSTTEEGEE